MANDHRSERPVSLLNKDFQGFRRDLLKMSQAHHSGVFDPTDTSSPDMAILELQAYVGDVLAYYIDDSFNEMRRETQRQLSNIQSFAKSLGYQPAGKRAARGKLLVAIEVPAIVNAAGVVIPDDSYSPVCTKGGQFGSTSGVTYETLDDVIFSASLDREVTGSRFDPVSGLPTYYAIRKPVEIVAGRTTSETFTLTTFQQFRRVELTELDVIEVIDVIDSDGNEWFQVDFLAQDTVYDNVVNTDVDNDVVPYVMKLVPAPRRFIIDRDIITGKTALVFGSGDGINFDDELIPNIADLAIPMSGRRTFGPVAIDPQNFLKTRSLGLSPYNTTITVRYRIGGGTETNVSPRSIKNPLKVQLQFSSTNLQANLRGVVESSISCINLTRTDGGGAAESPSEIKQNSAAFFAAQMRCVTREDYIARVLTLPAKFGKPDKVYVKRNGVSSLAMDIHVLSKDQSNHLAVASSTLKKNIKTYISPFRMATDGINIMDSEILNIGLSFGIIVAPKFNRAEVLSQCLATLVDELAVERMQIGQPIVISRLSALLQDLKGVISVFELKFRSLTGTDGTFEYSLSRFDPDAQVNDGIMYCPDNSVFEVKYPRHDLVGSAK